MELNKVRIKVDQLLAERRAAVKIVQTEKEELKQAKQKAKTAREGQLYAQQIVQAIQQATHRQLSSVVSRCLEGVFPDPYTFKFLFEQKRGKTEARPIFIRDGKEVDPIAAAGGGPGDCAAMALRIACLKLSKPPLRSFLALDEPFLSICDAYLETFRELLLKLSKDLNLQILLVTHAKEFQLGKVIQIGE